MQGIVWILFFYLLGCVIAALTGNFIPGSVVGMMLLFGALSAGWIKPWRMKRAAGFLLDNMMLFFIPVGVGLIASYSLVSKYLTAILVASIVSTVLVIVVVGTVEQRLESKRKTACALDADAGEGDNPAFVSSTPAAPSTLAETTGRKTSACAHGNPVAPGEIETSTLPLAQGKPSQKETGHE